MGKISADRLAGHLRLISMKGRIQGVAFEKNFAAEVVDSDEEICLQAVTDLEFASSFAVMDVADLLKIVDAFAGDIGLETKDDKLEIETTDGTIYYQLADADTIDTRFKGFEKLVEASFKGALKLIVGSLFLDSYDRFQKLISPSIIEFFVKDGKMMLRMTADSGHYAEIDVAPTDVSKIPEFKIGAAALRSVLDGIVLPGEEMMQLVIGETLGVVYRGYTFIVSRQVSA